MMSEAETAANKSLVQEFCDQVFSRGDISNIDRFMRDDYFQHNPTCADGRAGFLALGPQIKIIMVYVRFNCTLKNDHVNKDGQLAEHWDIIKHNAEGVQSRNSNGLF